MSEVQTGAFVEIMVVDEYGEAGEEEVKIDETFEDIEFDRSPDAIDWVQHGDPRTKRREGAEETTGSFSMLVTDDGQNLRVAAEGMDVYAPGDSIVIGFEQGDVLAHFPFEEGAYVTAVDGQHAGRIGKLESIKIIQSSSPNTVRIDVGDGTIETIQEYVVVIDEQFIPDDHPLLGGSGSGDDEE